MQSLFKSAFLVLTALLLGGWANPQPCETRGTSIVVTTSNHRLHLCEDGRSVLSYRVALGRGGLGKTREGDNKSPLGTYPLGRPRSSNEFHVFIPVGYPTREQKKMGYTGGDIGIHGPPPSFAKTSVSGLTAYFDWTRGCVALGLNTLIEDVARWVEAHPSAPIHLLP